MKKIISLVLLIVWCTSSLYCQRAVDEILHVRDRSAVIDSILEIRFDRLLPKLMERNDIDMWIVISREYNEDPVLKTMLPSTWLSARRRTILVFNKDKTTGDLEKIAIARYDVGKLMKGNWNLDVYPDQWDALMDIIKARKPENIGINISGDFGLADGLVYTEYKQFMEYLPQEYHERIVSAETLAIAWLETRTQEELELYETVCRIGHEILDEVFSSEYIKPGVTRTEDIVWELRNKILEYELQTWFHPTVSIQREDPDSFDHLRSFSNKPKGDIVQRGDLLHVDFGVSYLRLNSDQQQHFYVLKEGELEVPSFLVEAYKQGNQVQDILTKQFELGKTGNEILSQSLQEAKQKELMATIYTHPIGVHGHAAGPTIGMWDQQQGVKGKGDYPLFSNTAYSIELNAAVQIPEWNKVIRIMLEEDGYYDGKDFHYLDGRQLKIKAIR